VLVFAFSASHFTPGSQVTQLHYVSTAYALDVLDPAAPSTCVPGATLSATVTDAAGDSATGSGPIACA
jgi:hypothetical protein